MALNQTNKLAWIVQTIYKVKRISFEDLNEKWMENEDLSAGQELLKRTFHKWRVNILDTFGLNIECEKGGTYRYYISNANDLHNGSIEDWLLKTYTVSNTLIGCKSIKDRILLEEVPSAANYLEAIMDAMKQNRLIHITYYNYWQDSERQHFVMPLCLKLFRQRWYLVGKNKFNHMITIFCLDRITDFRLSSQSFNYVQEAFNPHTFFDGCIGVIANADVNIEHVVLKVSATQANYLRDLPIHESQMEKECHPDYSIFTMDVRPTFDFLQELLWNGECIEVMQPLWLRKEIAEKIQQMGNKYKSDNSPCRK